MATSPNEKFHSLLEEFGVAMLITRTKEDLIRARPMAVAQVEADGTLWFATGRHSGKVEDLDHDSQVAVTMQSKMCFVSISGQGKLVDDRARLDKMWKTEWKVWFPGGKDDPELVLLRVTIEAGEYWDNSGTAGLKYLVEAGKALLTGTRPDNVANDPKVHGKV
jgi:general stress protein 26